MLFRRIDHLVALDSAMLDLLVSQYAPPAHPLPATIIPNWESAAMFPLVREMRKWKEAEKLELTDRFVVLYLGNTGYGHQFETVLDAADQLRDDGVTFLFVGGGSRWDSIQQEAECRGLTNVLMHGYVSKDQTPVVMAGADCALITLRDIVLGVMSPSKLHANLAAGLPILYVGPKGSNVDDAIARFGCGASVQHGNADSAVAFIRRMKADRAEHAALKKRARAAFDAAYCDTQTLSAFDEVIESVVRRKANGDPMSGPGDGDSEPALRIVTDETRTSQQSSEVA
jgi:glycosyltransferase involved in cell wall biosynthesis